LIALETLNLRLLWWVENWIVTKVKVSEIVIGFITRSNGGCESLRHSTKGFEIDSDLE
jgi:hypothetical protein